MLSLKHLSFLILVCCCYVNCVEKELTVNIDPGSEDCFYQKVKKGDKIEIEYQVIDGGHGDLDITFRLAEPSGRILIQDFKKSENNHRADAATDGDYKLCFDNSFSSYNVKTVFFELVVYNDDDGEWGSDENMDFDKVQAFEVKAEDVQEIVNSVRNHLNKVRHLQDLIKSTEARDRNIAEENYFKVNTFSMVQITIMILVGLIQVVMVRSLFDDRSFGHKLWKKY